MQLHFELALLPEGICRAVSLTVAPDGSLAAVEPAPPGAALRPGLALPGMPNLHSHAFQRAMAGSAEVSGSEEHNFWGWREVMYRFVERLGPDDMADIAAYAYVEMLEAGYSEVAEFHYLHLDPANRPYATPTALADAVREGARRSGIRQLLLPTLYQRGGFRDEPLAGGQRRFGLQTESFLELCQSLRSGDGGRLQSGVALHSLRAVPDAALRQVVAAVSAAAPRCPVHMHVAEQQREVRDCLAVTGRRPLSLLLETGLIDPRWCLVHATHCDEAELRALAASGAVAGLCPSTEGNLGDGYFPFDGYLAAGGRFGIGTDSHVSLDPREELRLLEYHLRLRREQRALAASASQPHCGTFLYQHAQAGGAQACGRQSAGLVAGAPADLLVLDVNQPEFAAARAPALLDAWIFAPRPGAIAEVWVGGEALVSGGRHRAREPVARRYRQCLQRLLAA